MNLLQNQIGITVLSLCDGISGGQIAIKELGIPIHKYFSYEIKPTAVKVTQLNFPDTIQLGDLTQFDISHLQNEKIDLLLCGSPCQNMSLINVTGKTGVGGVKSVLIYKCVEIMKLVNPSYFLFENVRSMTNADKEVFNQLIGCEPIHIDSALFSAQKRNRYYWTNIPVEPPQDKGVLLNDILEKNPAREEEWSDKKKSVCKSQKKQLNVRPG